MIGRAYPNAALADLRLICDWNTALFVWDDQCDEAQLGWQPERLAARCEQFLHVLLSGAPGDPDDYEIRAFADVAQRLHQRMPPSWVRRFVHTVQEYVEGTLWEAHNRAHGVTPELGTYLRMRPLAGALFPYFEFADLSESIALPIEVRKHSAVARLSAMAANVVVWSNDLFSLDKELRHQDVHNLAVVLQRERRLDLQAAIDQAAELHNAEVRSFIELERQLRPLPARAGQRAGYHERDARPDAGRLSDARPRRSRSSRCGQLSATPPERAAAARPAAPPQPSAARRSEHASCGPDR